MLWFLGLPDCRPVASLQRVPVVQSDGTTGYIEIVDGWAKGAVYEEHGSDVVRILDPEPSLYPDF